MSVMVELAGEILEVTWSRPIDQIADFPTAFWLWAVTYVLHYAYILALYHVIAPQQSVMVEII
jgi:hypothetical protein